ncbi:hypothetical protein CEXT_526751 [Caerostris extrusa]|uniref:Uncharacterized protein n=1 Tax=Caerostris extrusa TaxID=172846 RepID=A0AAV4MV92_CAEEX|nr:hypothetical protein CEXT_526751 [Caerostris extrusa]
MSIRNYASPLLRVIILNPKLNPIGAVSMPASLKAPSAIGCHGSPCDKKSLQITQAPFRRNNSEPKIEANLSPSPRLFHSRRPLQSVSMAPTTPRVPREESALHNHNCTSITLHYFSCLLTRADRFACESNKRSGAFGGSLLLEGCSRALTDEENR